MLLHRMRSGCSGMNRQNLYARSAVLMDADSGRVLFGKDADVVRPMASTTKIMTCILALEYLKEHPDQTVEVSDQAASQPKVHLGMQRGEAFYHQRPAVFSDAGIAQ